MKKDETKCESCGIEMIRMRMVSGGTVYQCRNPKCARHGKEISK